MKKAIERSKQQVDDEIKALEACKAYAPARTAFGESNHRVIDLQIEYLRGQIDTTADEFYDDYSEREQDFIMHAENWEAGEDDEAPHAGWDSYKKKR